MREKWSKIASDMGSNLVSNALWDLIKAGCAVCLTKAIWQWTAMVTGAYPFLSAFILLLAFYFAFHLITVLSMHQRRDEKKPASVSPAEDNFRIEIKEGYAGWRKVGTNTFRDFAYILLQVNVTSIVTRDLSLVSFGFRLRIRTENRLSSIR